MASLIPQRRPKKPGMPGIKLSIPPRPSSSSSTVRQPEEPTGAGSHSQSTELSQLVTSAGSSSRPRPTLITTASPPADCDESATRPSHLARPDSKYSLQEDGYEQDGYLPYKSTANSIYPDTVPAGPLTDHQAWTNDLRRAIGDGGSGSAGRRTSTGESSTTRRFGEGSTNMERQRSSQLGNGQDEQGMPTSSLSTDSRSWAASLVSGAMDSQRRDDDGQGDKQASTSQDEFLNPPVLADAESDEDWVLKGNLDTLLRLGEGASGEVRKARHKPSGLVMAVKTIPTSPDPSVHRQILRELSFNRTCYSPYIVKYYGAFLSSDAQSIEICMEYCEAGSLDAVYRLVKSRNGRTGEKILGRVAECVLKGLHYLHDRHIIHRDIKPSNIVLTREGQIKLCDFGVSGELINSHAGTFTGTSYYMAPERIKGLPYTITSDVWSLGLTILEVASNRFPFPPEGEPPLGPVDLLSHIILMPTPELNDDPAAGIKWSRGLRDFIDRCLDKDGETRLGPKKMLTHPFIKKSEARQPPADVGKFVAEVYGWPMITSGSGESANSSATGSRQTASAVAPAPTASASNSGSGIAIPSAEDVLRLSRIASVRRAPTNPLAPKGLTSSSTANANNASISGVGAANRAAILGTAPGMAPVEREDLEGSSASDRLASKMREKDAGICGSPLDPELTAHDEQGQA